MAEVNTLNNGPCNRDMKRNSQSYDPFKKSVRSSGPIDVELPEQNTYNDNNKRAVIHD